MMPRYLSFVLVLVNILVGSPVFAWCESTPNVENEFRSSTVVFIGEVVAEKDIPEPGSFIAGTIYTIRVKEVLKGHLSQTTKLYSENSSGRFPMNIGSAYLVFASLGVFEGIKGSQLAINNCGNSGTLQETTKALAVVRKLSAAMAQPSAPGDAPEAARP